MSTPVAVLISDIHFTVPTLELAATSLLKAQFRAKMLGIPLIIAGDTLDTKAIIRAECANRLMRLLAVQDAPETYILVGNHDLLNEKGDDHSLQFLHGFCTKIVAAPTKVTLGGKQVLLLPYMSDSKKIEDILKDEETPKTIIMHQGVMGANMGHYIKDTSSLPPKAFDGYRVISGHYHRTQTIKCGKTGSFTYIGNPYTLSFGEAHDGPKGYQILMSDGSLEQVVLPLRKHVIVETSIKLETKVVCNKDDLLWVKMKGSSSELSKVSKVEIGKGLIGHTNFKLDLIPIDSEPTTKSVEDQTPQTLLDSLIDGLKDSISHKQYLKNLYKELL